MITVSITGVDEVQQMLREVPKKAGLALETAIDYSVMYGKSDVQKEMLKVFEQPTHYTINSVYAAKTKGHNMRGEVGFLTSPRMSETYLAPQIEGGNRKLKGFERGLDDQEYVPASGARRTTEGNVQWQQVKAALSDVKRRGPEYVHITQRRGKLIPGVYQRIKSGKGFARKVSRSAWRTLERGRSRGRFASAIIARGLKPVFLLGRTGHAVKPQLDFYGVAIATIDRVFEPKFWQTFNRLLP